MKKRYSVTLTEEKVVEFQTVSKEIGLPSGIMSQICEQAIESITASMKKFSELKSAKGTLTIGDFFSVMGDLIGKQIEEEMGKESKNDDDEKRPAVARKKRA